MPETIALLVFLTIDVVRPGHARIVCDGGAWAGTATREGRTYLVATDEGEHVGTARTYRDAAVRLAGHYGHPPAGVLVVEG